MAYEDVYRSLKVKQDLYVGRSIKGNGLINTANTVWYVNSNLSASGSGRSWDSAFLTLAEAVAVADDYDTILIAPDTIQTIATAGITITQNGLRILGANPHPGVQAASFKKTVGATPMFIIGADRVEIAGLCLSMRTAAACIQIGTTAIATAGAGVYQVYLHDNNLEGQTATYGVVPHNVGGTYADPVNLVVENNFFSGFATAAIVCNGTRDSYLNNTIMVPAAGIGIEYLKNAGDRGYGLIRGNRIYGSNSTDTGIKITNAPSAGLFNVAENYVMYCNTNITTGKGDTSFLMNYVSNATGGAIFDPSP
ncbi:MAG: hypothetical protein PHP65_00600 [Bacilli bacterium]|nr:hypothetical protein [Bacilli bacterium]